MSQWYYVVGTDRVGPIELEDLQALFSSGKINLETYVWRKGFANWEKYKSVEELVNRPIEFKEHVFSWGHVKETDEIFYIKIGMDRSSYNGENIFGPYSLNELSAAKDKNRINSKTWVYTLGMNSWMELGSTPLYVKNLKGIASEKQAFDSEINEVPWVFLWDQPSKPLWGIIVNNQRNGATLKTGSNVMKFENKNIDGVLKRGLDSSNRGIKISFKKYSPAKQAIDFSILNSFEEWNRIFN